jgi:hypothetical protein
MNCVFEVAYIVQFISVNSIMSTVNTPVSHRKDIPYVKQTNIEQNNKGIKQQVHSETSKQRQFLIYANFVFGVHLTMFIVRLTYMLNLI